MQRTLNFGVFKRLNQEFFAHSESGDKVTGQLELIGGVIANVSNAAVRLGHEERLPEALSLYDAETVCPPLSLTGLRDRIQGDVSNDRL